MGNKGGVIYDIRIPEVREVEQLLLKAGEFVGLPNPEVRLREWRRLSGARQAEDVDGFRAVYRGGSMVAGTYLHPGGFLIDLYVADGEDDALKILLKDMLAAPERYDDMRYSLSLANYPPRLRATLGTIFTRAGYVKATEHQVKCELIRLEELEKPPNVLDFSKDLEPRFELTYIGLAPNPWPWTIITQRAGGGKFNPELWLLSEAEDAILGVNEPLNNRTQGRIFNTVVALAKPGQEERLRPLFQEALRRAASEDPLGVVNAHVGETLFAVLKSLGFEEVESYPVFGPPQ